MSKLPTGGAPGRVVDRGRGCWNCQSFITGEQVLQKYLTLMAKEMVGLKELGKTPSRRLRQQLRKYESLIRTGQVGCCAKNDTRELSAGEQEQGKPGDFQTAEFYCSSWSGVTGHSVATEGHAPDLLPDELKDIKDKQ